MKNVLCFGDSNTWGYIPRFDDIDERFPESIRWTGRLQELGAGTLRVVAEGLNGRTTGLEEPGRPGRNGLLYLHPCLESHNPLDAVFLLLGANDLKKKFHPNPSAIAERMRQLIREVKATGKNGIGKPPLITLVSLHSVKPTPADINFQYPELSQRAQQVNRLYESVAKEEQVDFLNIEQEIISSEIDGVHLDSEMHHKLAGLIFSQLNKIFRDSRA